MVSLPLSPESRSDSQAVQAPRSHSMQCGELRAQWRADLGGCLSGLWLGEVPLLRSTPAQDLQSPRQSACYALLPYSNRIGHCRFEWGGREHTTRRNFGDHPHSLHGVGWQRAWEIVQADDCTLRMRLRHEPDEDWPFAFEAEQIIRLGALADHPNAGSHGMAVPALSGPHTIGLHWKVEVLNRDARTQPVGLGWHPYFVRDPESRLQARIARCWAHDGSGLPTSSAPHAPLKSPVEALDFDHCFEGWDGQALIEGAHPPLRLSASTSRLVVFTPPSAAHFCVEPVTHVNNAVQMDQPLDHGLVALGSGQRLQGWMRLEVAPNHRHGGPSLGVAPAQ